ncbi:transmembrane 4 L6 family member 1-like [Arapaima gigas]
MLCDKLRCHDNPGRINGPPGAGAIDQSLRGGTDHEDNGATVSMRPVCLLLTLLSPKQLASDTPALSALPGCSGAPGLTLRPFQGAAGSKTDTMCTGRCARCMGVLLFPLGLCAIVANVLLFFPDGGVWQTHEITEHVWLFGGVAGGGVLVFLPALVMKAAGREDGCCANRCGMMVSMVMSAVGTVGALYCVVVSALGLRDGPLCDTGTGEFRYPFLNRSESESYLFNETLWTECVRPANVVLWNITLFSILLVLGCMETLLCLMQVINGLFGCLCGTCLQKRQTGIA